MSDPLMAARILADELRREGITDARVLHAIAHTRRDLFVPPEWRSRAYDNSALPIGSEQTISQPYIVALMTEALELRGDEVVLEIGTGSGYQAAILSPLCRKVVTVERIPELSETAQRVIQELGYDNIEFHVADGTLGWPAGAPYDGILVTAAAPTLPQTLVAQLRDGGRLVIPVGDEYMQQLQVVTRQGDRALVRDLCPCVFVKLIGSEGWHLDRSGK